MVSHEERRLYRIGVLREALKVEQDRNILIKNCMMEWGASRRTILEYFKVIDDLAQPHT